MQKRYKAMEIELGCDCGECDNDSVFFVVDEDFEEKDFGNEASDDRILCQCSIKENADFIVSSLNRLVMN